MTVILRLMLSGVETTLTAESVERDPVHPKLLRLVGVGGLVLPEAPDFRVSSASVPRDSVLWYVEGVVPDPVARGRIEIEPDADGA